jgi:hypothetical protein
MRTIIIGLAVLLITGCRSESLERLEIQLDDSILNPVQQPGMTGRFKIVGYDSHGRQKIPDPSNVHISVKTLSASGGVPVIRLEGNKVVPLEGGVALIGAIYSGEGTTLTASAQVIVRPFYRDYHKSLVLKILMGVDGKPEIPDTADLVFQHKDPTLICSFAEALNVVKRVDNLTRGIPKIIYLVGWQGGKGWTSWPDWSLVKENLKRPEDPSGLESLRWLIREARNYNTTISLHINMVDASDKSPLWDEYVARDVIGRDEQGKVLEKWRYLKDEPNYHISYTREWEEGLAQRRIDRLIEMIPELTEGHTIHMDAFLAYFPPTNLALSPWHAMKEHGGIDMYREVETQRKIFHYWRDKGFDVTGEGLFWAHPKDEGFVGLQPMSWWFPDDKKFQMQIPERLSARGATERGKGGQELGQGDFRFGSSMHGEQIFLKSLDTLPGFLREFCTMTLPWYYLSQLERIAFENDVLYYSEGVMAGMENGKKIIRRGNFILRQDDDLFVPALWKEREIIAYSQSGYANREWLMPENWKDVKSADIYKITLQGSVLLQSDVRVNRGKIMLTLGREEGVSIVPKGLK